MGTAGGRRSRQILGAACGFVFLAAADASDASKDLAAGVEPHTRPAVRLALSEDAEPKLDLPAGGGLVAPQRDDIGESMSPPDIQEQPGDRLETDVEDPEQPLTEAPNVRVSHDLTLLPAPVLRMRELIVDAATRGDIEGLRPLLGSGPTRTELSISGFEGDPIDFLRDSSGDPEGHELLAILIDILEAGYAHVDAGDPTELFLWPYFYAVPLEELDDRQRVELFRIITAGDYEDMRGYGGYNFYRTAIGPDGEWKFFLAGD